ncbi:MAG: DUF1501 domain-containing protein, partial [Gemmataceae bacterium]
MSLLHTTRRHFFEQCGIGLGAIALQELLLGQGQAIPTKAPLPHHKPRAKRVIFLFMAGGPSQLDLFDYKPKLNAWHGKPVPEEFLRGKRFAFMDTFAKKTPTLLGSKRKFKQHGQAGSWVSECLPHLAKIVDDLAIVRSVTTSVFNHAPAKLFMNTGSAQNGRPSLGAWLTYGLGSEANDLPGFVVLQSGPRGPRGGAPLYGSGFLPTTYQGVPFRSTGDPILNLGRPQSSSSAQERDLIDTINELNNERLRITGDPEIQTRIQAYEMAYRMQSSAPELIDLSGETRRTLEMYGATPGKPSFANNCLLARRLVERGVRFVQLYHTDWDHHGNGAENLDSGLDRVCKQVDQPCAALVRDLKQRGLLDSTLIVWMGDFGRTPNINSRGEKPGRDHYPKAWSLAMFGGGIPGGQVIGATDKEGAVVTERQVSAL